MTGINPGSYMLDAWKDLDNNNAQNTNDFYGVYGDIDLSAPNWNPNKLKHFNPINIQIADGETVLVDVMMQFLP